MMCRMLTSRFVRSLGTQNPFVIRTSFKGTAEIG
jgi:hypothetical protein